MPYRELVGKGGIVAEVDAQHRLLVAQKYTDAVVVTPSDTTDLTKKPTAALHIGGAGDVVLTLADMTDGTSVKLEAIADGTTLPIAVKRVFAAGTTATGIIALY
jgi:hypothetical protein